MAVSQTRRLSIEKYRREKRDQLAVDVSKGKRDVYKAGAATLRLSLSMLIQTVVEDYLSRHAGEDFITAPTPKPESDCSNLSTCLSDGFGQNNRGGCRDVQALGVPAHRYENLAGDVEYFF